jgi:hypothetical protein
VAVADDTQRQLEWERRQRPRAGIAAIVAAALLLGADLWTTALFRDAPKGRFLDALATALEPGKMGAAETLRTPYYQYYDEHASTFLLSSAIKGVGFIALAWALTFLMAATRARRAEVPRPIGYLPLVGAVLSAIATVLFSFAYADAVRGFLGGPHTVDRATAAGTDSGLVTSQFIGLAGQLALAGGYVFVSLNAMRAGLLTRFMGILGVIIGVLVIIPLGPLPVVQACWLLALGALLLNLWPKGAPPAWRTGEAHPWPSQAEVSQQRRAAVEARRAAKAGEPPAPAGDAPAADAPARRKRKRRS